MFAVSDAPAPRLPLADAIAAVRAAVADLVDADVDGAADEELRAALPELTATAAQVAGATVRVTDVFETRRLWAGDGARSPQAWLRHRAGLAGEDASRQVRHSRVLRDLPQTRAALCAGEITAAHVQRIVAAANPRTRDQLQADEARIVDWAHTERYDRFCARLAEWVLEHDPDGGFRPRPDRRRLHLWKLEQDGWIVDGWLDPISGQIVHAELARLEQQLFEQDWREAKDRLGRDPHAHELARTRAQRRADALVCMARRSATMGDGRPGRVLITVVTGTDRFRGICELLDGTILADEEVVRVVDGDTVFERIVFDETEPIAASKQRIFTGLLRRAITIRDRECVHPLCDEPAERCQVDHIHPWTAGGHTRLDNGRLYCGHHNRARNQRPPPPPDDG